MMEMEGVSDGEKSLDEERAREEKKARTSTPVVENPYKKKGKNEEISEHYKQKRHKPNQEYPVRELVNEMEIKDGSGEPKRWVDYTSSEESMSDGEFAINRTSPERSRNNEYDEKLEDKKMNEMKTKKDEMREIKHAGETSNNPWKMDTRPNSVRFSNQSIQKTGYWAKVKFEIFGYHTEKDKKGDTRLYTFETDTVKEVLRAIMRKGKMIDETFSILPRGANDNRKITCEENIEHMVKELNKSLWLEGELKRYRRPDGKINEIRKTIKSGFNMDMGIRFTTDKLNDENIETFVRDWHYVARNEPNTYLYMNEADMNKKIRIHELILRPVQEEHVEEVAYILGSTSRNQDGIKELINHFENFVEEKLNIRIKIGARWTTPDLGYVDLTRLWTKARREQDPKLRRAMEPSIMVLYMGLGGHTKRIRMDTIKVLMDQWGNFTKVTTEKGRQVSQFGELPGGNKGVLIPPVDTLTKDDKEALLTLYDRHISNKVNHNLWIQTNIMNMDYEIQGMQGQKMTIREYILNNELVPGMFAFNGIIKYHDIWNEYPDKYYLVTNNVTGEAATKRLEQIMRDIIQKDPLATSAFHNATIGPMTAFSSERNEPSRLNAIKFNLKELVEADKMRLNDIIIDGKKVMESERSTENATPWNVNEMSSNRTYTTAQLTQSIIGMEIMTDEDNDNGELTDEEEKSKEPHPSSNIRPSNVSQSPAANQEVQQTDMEGFTLIQKKKSKKESQVTNDTRTRASVTKIQINEKIAENMRGGTINVTAGNTYNLLNQKEEDEGEEEDSVISAGQSQSSSSSSTDSLLDRASTNMGEREEESSSDLEPILPAGIHDNKRRDNVEINDKETEIQQLRKQYREIETLLKMKNEYSIQRRRNEMNRNKGGRGGRGAITRAEKKRQSYVEQGDPNKSKNE